MTAGELLFDDGATQTFHVNGDTSYVEGDGRPTKGKWYVDEDGRFCSFWPPTYRACYGLLWIVEGDEIVGLSFTEPRRGTRFDGRYTTLPPGSRSGRGPPAKPSSLRPATSPPAFGLAIASLRGRKKQYGIDQGERAAERTEQQCSLECAARDCSLRHRRPRFASGALDTRRESRPLKPGGRSVDRPTRLLELEHGLEYPVGLDNDFVAWNAYGNRYWPTMHLIDRAGRIRYTQIGEGNYGRTEGAIRALLAEDVGPAADREAS